jgi:hypothetical protein
MSFPIMVREFAGHPFGTRKKACSPYRVGRAIILFPAAQTRESSISLYLIISSQHCPKPLKMRYFKAKNKGFPD